MRYANTAAQPARSPSARPASPTATARPAKVAAARARAPIALLACSVGAVLVLAPIAASAASVTLAWDANVEPDVIGYKLYYDSDISGAPYDGTDANEGTSPVDIPLASLADASAPEYVLSGLPSCTFFYFAVTAYSADAESDYSTEVSARLVAKPESVTATAESPTSLRIDWTAPPGDDDGVIPRFFIHYDTDTGEPYEGAGSPIEIATSSLPNPDVPSYVLTGLTTGVTYYVAVSSGCDDDTRKLSDETTGVPDEPATGGSGTGGTGTGGTGTGNTGNTGTGATGTGGSGTGATGTGGAGTGNTGTGASSAASSSTADEAGCGCRTSGGEQHGRGLPAAALVLGLALARRRRRR